MANLPHLSLVQSLALIPVSIILYVGCKIIYAFYFHPLSKFPGPKLAAISHAWYGIHWMGGKYPLDIATAHAKYGPIVRIAPNELSFANVETYKEIYGHATKSRRPFIKSTWYAMKGQDHGVAMERDPIKHRDMRKSLAHAFSDKALRTQSDILIKYIDMFVAQIKRLGQQEKGLPMEEWYNWLTFDVIGDLAFGESFGAVASAKPSIWVETICEAIYANSIHDVGNRIPILRYIGKYFLPSHDELLAKKDMFLSLSREKTKARLHMENTRDDFFSHVLQAKEANITENYLQQQAQTLIVAGSETTSTFLAGVTFYLTTNPVQMSRLTKEVRGAFKESSEISAENTAQLPYLAAVIEEGLRIYNPAPFGLPRISPGAEVDGHFIPEGIVLSTSPWTSQHRSDYWCEPDQFWPERWLPKTDPRFEDRFKDDVKDASKPFSLGPRGCLGLNLAYLESRMILAKLVFHFDWELVVKDLDWNRDTELYTLWKKPALMVKYRAVN